MLSYIPLILDAFNIEADSFDSHLLSHHSGPSIVHALKMCTHLRGNLCLHREGDFYESQFYAVSFLWLGKLVGWWWFLAWNRSIESFRKYC